MTPKSEESGYVECEKEEEQVKEQLKVAYAYSSPLIDKAGEHAATGFDWLKKALGTVTGTEKVGFVSTPLTHTLSLGLSPFANPRSSSLPLPLRFTSGSRSGSRTRPF